MTTLKLRFLGVVLIALANPSASVPISTYSLSDNDVTYHLYTPANPTAAKDFKIGGVATSGINAKLPFKILIHGWQASVDVDWYAGVVAEYLKKGEYNVIAVDWSGPAAAMYGDAVDAAFEVAEVNTRFVQELYEKLGVAPENLHFIGHSLGAQISGLTGQNVFKLLGRQIGRVTGLDPAGPSWNGNTADQRLSPDDAVFVDAVHTDGNFLGYGDRLADADFYPNGGTQQNGCGIFAIGCGHNLAPTYFVESINSPGFVGRKCDSYSLFTAGKCENNAEAIMGEDASTNAEGAFYFNTNSAAPFALGVAGLL